MAHDTHFLQRLDRVSDAHVELALGLYRDQELLREVLNRAGLPEGVERLAISLDHDVEGPFVIVTRAGSFVTCLGRGMRVRREQAAYVLPRARLDAAIARVERMRERVAEIERLACEGAEGVSARAIRRLHEDGLRFCQEDADTLLGVMPLIASEIASAVAKSATWLESAKRLVAPLRFHRLRPYEEDLAVAFGQGVWGFSHLLVLADHEDVQDIFEDANSQSDDAMDVRVLFAKQAFDLGTFSHGTRSVWGLARQRRSVLPGVKALTWQPEAPARMLRELTLGAIARSSSKLRAEATKALSPVASCEQFGSPTYEQVLADVSGWVGSMVRQVLESPAEQEAAATEQGQIVAARMIHRTMTPSPEQLAAVPVEVAQSIYSVLPMSFLGEKMAHGVPQLASMLPWIARAAPRDHFLPREDALRLPLGTLQDVQVMIETYAAANRLGRPKPVVRAGKVGRNDACRCGSEKKAKRCCGVG